jgi:hypothetical protein
MIKQSTGFANAIVRYSRQGYFHGAEVGSRGLLGAILLMGSAGTQAPMLFNFIGYLLIAVAIGLIIVGERRHRQFAIWSVSRFHGYFRLAGCFSLGFAILVCALAFP